jgi:hypothetical protein
MVSLSNHEVGYTNPATTSPFDKLRVRSTEGFNPPAAPATPSHKPLAPR